ncbi:putative bifunctional diguanylate cyclase/phosphodiesterase [Paenibacillus chartarius]|uniref:Bifunctional diguanylate cyclase/phosphodiesterase n=1 Tax=Paenibacillus chartarius TaxID=747481 RepID=A0ABV6DMX6_9BACL
MRNRWLFSLGHLLTPIMICIAMARSAFDLSYVFLIVLSSLWALILTRWVDTQAFSGQARKLPVALMVMDISLLSLILAIPDWSVFSPIWIMQSILLLYAVEYGYRTSVLFGAAIIALATLFELKLNVPLEQFVSDLFPFVLVASLNVVVIGKVTDKLQRLAYCDTLTSLPNRTFMQAALQESVAQAAETKQKAAFLLFDLDSFKHVNDTLGHEAGDELLLQASVRLRSQLPLGVTLARFGGDEFTAIISPYDHVDDVQEVAELILNALREPFHISGIPLHISASIGISLYPQHAGDAAELLKYADAAMYSAKKQRNHYEFFRPSDAADSAERLFLESDLTAALGRGEFELYYQPQIRHGSIIGFEALLRWNHPTRGLIPPASFIPLAEQRGHILGIGNWVLVTACRQFRDMLEQGHTLEHIAVNISVSQFYQLHFVRNIHNALIESGLEPHYLQLEITESAAMKNVPYFIDTLNELHKLGIKIAIDDFGTGYSSFNYLSQFPLDALKIDRSFIWNMDKGDKHVSVVGGIILMASALQLDVVAEGVETQEQAQLLEELGCTVAQGYLYGRPLPLREAYALLGEPGQHAAALTG